MHLNHYENPYSRLAQYMSCAGAPIWCTAQAMPTTSDKYTLLTWTHVPIEDFPPCDKRYDSEETDKENTTRTLGKEIVTKVIFADKDKSGSCSKKTPMEDFPPCDKRYDSEETDKENTTRALDKEISGAAGDTNDCKSISLKHTHIQDSSSSVEISAAAVLAKL